MAVQLSVNRLSNHWTVDVTHGPEKTLLAAWQSNQFLAFARLPHRTNHAAETSEEHRSGKVKCLVWLQLVALRGFAST